MLRLGVPEYRLPRELIRLEINAILSLGVNLQLGWDAIFTFGICEMPGTTPFFWQWVLTKAAL
jgi:hypothetical protein